MPLTPGQKTAWPFPQRVKVAPSWDSPWQVIDYLHCLEFIDTAAPAVPSASLIYHAGYIKREDQPTKQNYPPLNLSGWFVRIEVLDPATLESDTPTIKLQWTGIIQGASLVHHGPGPNDENEAPVDQRFSAYGLEHFLDLQSIRGSYVREPVSGVDTPVFVSRMLSFNDRITWAFSKVGNRSNAELAIDGGGTAHVFDGSIDGGSDWSVLNAVKYLIGFFAPDNMLLDLAGQYAALDDILLPKMDLQGLTLKQALDHLINPRQGFGWCLRVPIPMDDTGDETVHVHIFSTAATDQTLDDQTLPANAEIVSMDLTDRLDVPAAGLIDDDRGSYGRIVARGEHLLVCATFSIADNTLERGWSAADETAYHDVTGATPEEKDAKRQTDELRAVFRVLRVPSDWDFMAGDGAGGEQHNANPAISTAGELNADTQAHIRHGWGLSFERNVPFFKAQYTSSLQPDYREAIVYVWDETTEAFIYLEAVPGMVRLLDNDLGIEVTTNPAHLLGLGHVDDIDSASVPVFDYEKLAVTAAFRTDERLQVQLEPEIIQYDGESDDDYDARVATLQARVLYIDVPHAELWYIVPGTADTVGSLHAGGAIRNDIDVVKRAALSASAWFGQPRHNLQVSFQSLETSFAVGNLIDTYTDSGTDHPVNAVITSRHVDLQQGTTTFQTNFASPHFGDNPDPGPWGRRGNPFARGGE